MKRQHYIGIAVGIFIGSIVALFFENRWTAVLIGTTTIFATAWIAGLEWNKAVGFSKELSGKMSVRGTGKILWIAIMCIPYYVICLPIARIFYKIPKRMKKDIPFRKLVVYFIVLLLMTTGMIFVEYEMFHNTCLADVNFGSDFITGLFLVSGILMIPAILLTISLTVVLMLTNCEDESPRHILYSIENWFDDIEDILGNNTIVDFTTQWIHNGIVDDKNAFSSVFYMLKIRIRNGLIMLAFPFILILYGFFALATHYTALSAFIAVIVGGIHLYTSYHFGWIDWGNINFILSVAVAMFCGCSAGWIIGKLLERIKVPKMKLLIVFREHEEVKVIA